MSKIKRLFTPKDVHGNVVLNFRGSPRNELAALANSYLRAATVLKNKFVSAAGYHDLDACPIVFEYRHALELFLKAICNIGNHLSILMADSSLHTDNVFADHSLSRHLDSIKRIFNAVGWGQDYHFMGLEEPIFEEIIKEFDGLDRGSYTFRYTTNKDGTPNIAKHFVFSVTEFASTMEPILTNLSGACMGLEEERDAMADAHFESMDDAHEDRTDDGYEEMMAEGYDEMRGDAEPDCY